MRKTLVCTLIMLLIAGAGGSASLLDEIRQDIKANIINKKSVSQEDKNRISSIKPDREFILIGIRFDDEQQFNDSKEVLKDYFQSISTSNDNDYMAYGIPIGAGSQSNYYLKSVEERFVNVKADVLKLISLGFKPFIILPYAKEHNPFKDKSIIAYDEINEEYQRLSQETYVVTKILSEDKKIVSFHKDGKLQAELTTDGLGSHTMEGKIPDGIAKEYHFNGSVAVERNYRNNQLNGIEKIYTIDGDLICQRSFTNNVLNGEVMYWYESGQVKSQVLFQDGHKEGLEKRFNEDGHIVLEANWKNGKLDGEYKEYRDKGTLYILSHYKEGKQEGVWKQFYQSGELNYRGMFKNDKQEGVEERFYPNGSLRHKVNYIHGKPGGHFIEFNEDGSVKHRREYIELGTYTARLKESGWQEVRAIINTAVDDRGQQTLFNDLNSNITNLQAYKNIKSGQIKIIFDISLVEPKGRYKLPGIYKFLVRVFDNNGSYLNHFITEDINILFAKDRDKERIVYRKDSQGTEELTYTVNTRDISHIKIIEFGVID